MQQNTDVSELQILLELTKCGGSKGGPQEYVDPLHIDEHTIPKDEKWCWIRFTHTDSRAFDDPEDLYLGNFDIDIGHLMQCAAKGYTPVSSAKFPHLVTEQRKPYSNDHYIMYKGLILCSMPKSEKVNCSYENDILNVARQYEHNLLEAAGPEIQSGVKGFFIVS
jgi:hypothetical protein